MLSVICLNLDQSKILSSGNGLRAEKYTGYTAVMTIVDCYTVDI